MKQVLMILWILGLGAIGYVVGYLSGAITGIVLYYRKSHNEDHKNQILEELDRTTVWDFSDFD